MAKQTKGFCKYCGKEYTKGGMLRHLATCKKRKAGQESAVTGKQRKGYFELVIYDRYVTSYWLIIEIAETATLSDLDHFLRDIWVECCGHLSAFEIDGVNYEVFPDMDDIWGEPSENMEHKLKDVFTVGQVARYEYDFGSTTELLIQVHGYNKYEGKKQKLTILSRNNPPEIICGQCGKNKAEWIDMEAYEDEFPFLCTECILAAEEEICREDDIGDFFVSICNSPRMGVCGYEGSSCYPDQFCPDEEA